MTGIQEVPGGNDEGVTDQAAVALSRICDSGFPSSCSSGFKEGRRDCIGSLPAKCAHILKQWHDRPELVSWLTHAGNAARFDAMRQYARRRSWKAVKAVEDVGSGASKVEVKMQTVYAGLLLDHSVTFWQPRIQVASN